jgi:lipopolysaccharide export system protein LptA
VHARCRGINNRLASDSAEYYEVNGMMLLVNNVSYDEPGRVHLTANRLTYYTANEQLVAEGNVVLTMPSGTTMTGPQAEYLREAPGIRDRARLTAIGRPILRVVTSPTDSQRPHGADAASKDTATIIANTILDEGDSLVYASGQVQIIRPDVTATSDSATFDQGTELAHLVNNAQIKGTRGRPFTLSGSLVDLYSKQRELTRVVSRGKARVLSDDLDLKSDTVDLRVRESRVERAYAWGPSRAVATSPDRDVVADSIEAIMPAQRIRELHAVRRAVARSVPDTTKITSKERDFLAGDTIVARFDTLTAAQDTTKNPPVKQIVAEGNASSLYQIASSEGRTTKPAINYVKGRRITVDFDSSTVQTVTVTDSATGVYLEPGDSTSDSTAARRRANTPRAGAAGARGGATPAIRRPGGRPPSGGSEEQTAVSPFLLERAPRVRANEVHRD